MSTKTNTVKKEQQHRMLFMPSTQVDKTVRFASRKVVRRANAKAMVKFDAMFRRLASD
jgi:hypothetical protein